MTLSISLIMLRVRLSVTVIFLLLYLPLLTNGKNDKIKCQCGNRGTIFKLPHKYKELCEKFKFCDTCQDSVLQCVSCPKERTGLFCQKKFKEVVSFQHLNQSLQAKRRSIRGVRCHDLQPPKLGTINCWFSRREKECTGRCFPGHYFSRHGEEIVLTCGDNGRWNPMTTFPSCASRGYCDLEMKGAGSYNCTTRSSGTTCNIRCSGYPHVHADFFCNPGRSGEWEPRLPYCVKRKGQQPTSPTHPPHPTYPTRAVCQNPGHLENGKIQGITRQSYEEGSTVSYSCDYGFRLDGSNIIECTSYGTWSPSPPTCRQMRTTTTSTTEKPIERTITCSDPGFLLNGERTNTDGRPSGIGQTFVSGVSVVFSCDQNFALDGPSLLTCLPSGRWSKPLPQCRRVTPVTVEPEERTQTCSDPGFVPNGQRWNVNREVSDFQDTFGEGESVVFSCQERFSLHGSSLLTCQPSGRWSNPLPKCKRTPRGPTSTTTSTTTTTTTAEPEELLYCDDPGVDVNGEREEIALVDARRKPKPDMSRLEERVFPVGMKLDYSCFDGYKLKGAKTLTCQFDGLWSNVRPICILINQPNPPKPPNVDYENLIYCPDPGYIADGRREVVYGIDRRRGSGSVEDEEEFAEGTQLVFSCEEDLEISGKDTLICTSSGTWSSSLPECLKGCGSSPVMESRRITQGQKTTLGQWPWQVAIGVSNGRIFCGAVLVSQHSVLTAAHCLEGRRAQNTNLYFGKYYFNSNRDDDKVLVRKASSILIHPYYDPATLDDDIAIIKFKPDVEHSSRINPICLPNAETTRKHLVRGKKGWVTGWGVTENHTNPEVLLMAHIPVVPTKECLDAYEAQRMVFLITDNMFCAGYQEGRIDSCTGDSGGPMVFYEPETNRFVLEGIVSFGVQGGCGVPKRYSVYTKVQKMIRWIRANT